LLLTGSPDMRRSYLDDLLEQTISGYGALRRNYRRALSQRNALLKHGATASQPELFPWNVRLSQLGGQIARYRQEMVTQIAASASQLYSALAKHDSDVVVSYESKLPFDNYETSLLKHLENYAEIDRQRGFTGYGPHRDDLQIYLNGQPLQSTASRGETRTTVLMLKITELKLIEQARDQKPLFLLDDVFSELDGARRHALTHYLADYQAFITTTDADVVIQHFTESANIIPLA
jgi:DNA replication and repair protein RecF